MNQLHTKEQLIKMLDSLTDKECEGLISIWSMRPAPLSPEGQAWEAGALWGWKHYRDNMKWKLNNPK